MPQAKKKTGTKKHTTKTETDMPTASARQAIDQTFKAAFSRDDSGQADDPAAGERQKLQQQLRAAAEHEDELRGQFQRWQGIWNAACTERRRGGDIQYSDAELITARNQVHRLRSQAHRADQLRAQLREPRLFTASQRQRIRDLEARRASNAELRGVREESNNQRGETEKLKRELEHDREREQVGRNAVYHPHDADRERAQRQIQDAEQRAAAADERLAEMNRTTESIDAKISEIRNENVCA